jgi:hypothetical protein
MCILKEVNVIWSLAQIGLFGRRGLVPPSLYGGVLVLTCTERYNEKLVSITAKVINIFPAPAVAVAA